MSEDEAPVGFLVGRKLEHELRSFGGAESRLEEFCGEEGGDGAQGVDREKSERLRSGARNEQGHEQEIDGKAGGAGRPREDEDRRESFFGTGNAASSHDAGEGTGITGEEWKEGLSREAHATHHAVHEEGGARHVTTTFEQTDEEEKEEDLREKDNDRPDPADDSIDEQVAEIAFGEKAANPVAERALGVFDEAHGNFGKTENAPENSEHDG